MICLKISVWSRCRKRPVVVAGGQWDQVFSTSENHQKMHRWHGLNHFRRQHCNTARGHPLKAAPFGNGHPFGTYETSQQNAAGWLDLFWKKKQTSGSWGPRSELFDSQYNFFILWTLGVVSPLVRYQLKIEFLLNQWWTFSWWLPVGNHRNGSAMILGSSVRIQFFSPRPRHKKKKKLPFCEQLWIESKCDSCWVFSIIDQLLVWGLGWWLSLS